MIVIARQRLFPVRVILITRFFAGLRRLSDDCQAVWFVTEKDVRDFFHQCGAISLRPVRGIKNHQLPTVRQRPGARAARPLVRAFT